MKIIYYLLFYEHKKLKNIKELNFQNFSSNFKLATIEMKKLIIYNVIIL